MNSKPREIIARKFSLIIAALLTAAGASAANFTNVYSFSGPIFPGGSNGDGANPQGGLVLSGGKLYGAADDGGGMGAGTVFAVNRDGTGFTNLHNFDPALEGANPQAGFLLSGGTLYGTTLLGGGGGNNSGAVFAVNTDGSGFTNLHIFTGASDGAFPKGGLTLSGGALYGTTQKGGNNNQGTVFKINANGTGFTNLYSFTALTSNTNSGGAGPRARLVLSGGTLFGTAEFGGTGGAGAVFKLNTDGTGFSNLYSFAALASNTNSDGAFPATALVLSGSMLYGTTDGGGLSGGTVFKLDTNGMGFATLHQFSPNSLCNTNSDGSIPQGNLILSGGRLYGTTFSHGPSDGGTVYQVNTDGSGFAALHSFTGGSDGANPMGGLVWSAGSLYGTASQGGTGTVGAVFEVRAHPGFFNGEVALSNGVYYLAFSNGNLLGYYTYQFFPYLYHFDLGFVYFFDANDGQSGAYLYDFASGHFWYTSPLYPFPYLYDFSLNAVIYYFPDSNNAGRYTKNPRFFYNFATQQVFMQ